MSRYVLLGEPGYPLQPWLMKAYSKKKEEEEDEEEEGLAEPRRAFNQAGFIFNNTEQNHSGIKLKVVTSFFFKSQFQSTFQTFYTVVS